MRSVSRQVEDALKNMCVGEEDPEDDEVCQDIPDTFHRWRV